MTAHAKFHSVASDFLDAATLEIMDIGGRKMGKRKKTPPETNFETSNPESINLSRL